jgi:pimeloyl-ACP methyl ester carboxylesterase
MRSLDDQGVGVGETMVPAGGVDLCVETFGERTDPAVLLIAGGASAMDWWADEFCRRLAAGGRFVIRYDHRDTGRSTSFPAGAPRYSLVDLADDAVRLLDSLEIGRAHLVGLALGGALALRIAVAYPDTVLSLTLISTSLGAPRAGSIATDWSDRAAAIDSMVAFVRGYGGLFTADEPQIRRLAGRVFDRTNDMVASQTNHWLVDGGPPVHDLLGTIAVPAVVMHGTQDTLIPMAEAEALARAIPGARLVWMEGIGHEFPPAAVWRQVIGQILRVDSAESGS